jgi:hypothetical protein
LCLNNIAQAPKMRNFFNPFRDSVKVLFYAMLPDFRKNIALWEFPGFAR